MSIEGGVKFTAVHFIIPEKNTKEVWISLEIIS